MRQNQIFPAVGDTWKSTVETMHFHRDMNYKISKIFQSSEGLIIFMKDKYGWDIPKKLGSFEATTKTQSDMFKRMKKSRVNFMIESGAESKGTQDALKGERLNEIELYKSKGLSQEQAEELFNQKHPDWDNQVASAMKGDFWMQMPMLLGTGSMMHKAIFGKALDKVENTVEYGLNGRVGSMAKQWGKATLYEGFIEDRNDFLRTSDLRGAGLQF